MRTPQSKRPRPRARRETAEPIPAQLAGLIALLRGDAAGAEPQDAPPVVRALAAARSALRNGLTNNVSEAVTGFVHDEAASGAWKDLYAVLSEINEHDGLDQYRTLAEGRWTAGDYHNAYVCPTLTISLALAYVYFVEGGAR